jgi:hypothetical protein
MGAILGRSLRVRSENQSPKSLDFEEPVSQQNYLETRLAKIRNSQFALSVILTGNNWRTIGNREYRDN